MGSRSNIPASWVKVGLSLGPADQQADRISCGEDETEESEAKQLTLLPALAKVQRPAYKTHRDLLPRVSCRQHLLDALAATKEPDFSLHRLVGERPVPRLKLVPDCAEIRLNNNQRRKWRNAAPWRTVAEVHVQAGKSQLINTQKRKHQQLWRRAAGPRPLLGSSASRPLEPSSRANRGESATRSSS